MRFTCGDFTINWQYLEKGIVTGCTVSDILFSPAINLLFKVVEKLRRGVVLASGIKQTSVRAFMDELTITVRSVPEGRWILEDLCKIIAGARMESKPLKSRSLVLRKGRVQDLFCFRIGEELIPTISKRPVKSLGKWYRALLNKRV